MRSIATCYSEQAIKVSDSYCSGPASSRTSISQYPTRPAPSSVASTYKIRNSSTSSGAIFVTVKWSGTGGGSGGFAVSVTEKFPSSAPPSFHHLWKPKGSKEFEACGCRVELFWNLSPAFYHAGPEPVSGYYVAVLIDSEPGLFLGDVEEIEDDDREDGLRGGVNREKIRLAAELSPISRIEKFVSDGSGHGSYSTRAQFSRVGEVHDVMINFGSAEAPGMSVWIDGRRVFQVRRLRWNFRGNQTIFLDGIVVDVMWDLHEWSLKETGEQEEENGGGGGGGGGRTTSRGAAVFLFRTRSGLDSRLWLEEKILEQKKDPERAEYSLLICACKNPG